MGQKKLANRTRRRPSLSSPSHVCFPGFDQIGRGSRISPMLDRKMAGWGLDDQDMSLTKNLHLDGASMNWPTSMSTRALPWSGTGAAALPPPPEGNSRPGVTLASMALSPVLKPFETAPFKTIQTKSRLNLSLENSKYWRGESNASQFEVEKEGKRRGDELYDVSPYYPGKKELGRRFFHMPKTDVNRYANSFSVHYPPELYDVAGNRKPKDQCFTRA